MKLKQMKSITGNLAPMRAQDYSEIEDWSGYYKSVAGKGARETLLQGLDLFKKEGISNGFAIDLAAGEGRDSIELLKKGWKVLATDNHPEASEYLWSRVPESLKTNLQTKEVSFEKMILPPSDLINASFALPFCEPQHFNLFWNKIKKSIRKGGRFTGQFFGDRDTWALKPKRSHHSHSEVLEMLNDFSIEIIREEEHDDPLNTRNPKHWHIFHIVAKKK